MTSEEFKLLYPEFTEIADELINVNLQKAQVMVSEKFWKQYYLEAIGLITAHEITIRQNEQLNTDMKMAMIRGGKGFSEPRFSEYYSMTAYGQRLLQLRRQIAICGFVV